MAGYSPWVHKEWDMTERFNNIKYQKPLLGLESEAEVCMQEVY